MSAGQRRRQVVAISPLSDGAAPARGRPLHWAQTFSGSTLVLPSDAKCCSLLGSAVHRRDLLARSIKQIINKSQIKHLNSIRHFTTNTDGDCDHSTFVFLGPSEVCGVCRVCVSTVRLYTAMCVCLSLSKTCGRSMK